MNGQYSELMPVQTGHRRGKAKPEPENRKRTVLVVDDDKKILEAFRLFLESEDCTMIACTDVDEAMEKAKVNTIDLLITDFYLKTKSSVELYTLIRKVYPVIPIAVITGYPEYIGEEDVKMFGANYYFTKPLELERLREIVRSIPVSATIH